MMSESEKIKLFRHLILLLKIQKYIEKICKLYKNFFILYYYI